jgi:hypothetical protein
VTVEMLPFKEVEHCDKRRVAAVGTFVYARLGPAMLWGGAGAVGPLLFAGFNALAARLRPSSGA